MCRACRHHALHCALDLLSSPLPQLAYPPAAAPVEVKALAAAEEAAYESLRGLAAWQVARADLTPAPGYSRAMPTLYCRCLWRRWLGEHAHALALDLGGAPLAAQRASGPDRSAELSMDCLSLASKAMCPKLAAVLSHLHRAMLAGKLPDEGADAPDASPAELMAWMR